VIYEVGVLVGLHQRGRPLGTLPQDERRRQRRGLDGAHCATLLQDLDNIVEGRDVNYTVRRCASFGTDVAVVGVLGGGLLVMFVADRYRPRRRSGIVRAARMAEVEHLRGNGEEQH
jgi:hypothetical protein